MNVFVITTADVTPSEYRFWCCTDTAWLHEQWPLTFTTFSVENVG